MEETTIKHENQDYLVVYNIGLDSNLAEIEEVWNKHSNSIVNDEILYEQLERKLRAQLRSNQGS